MAQKSIEIVEGFEPCRLEGCSEGDELHPKHAESKLPPCPSCQADLIKMPKKRARCSCCSWRGSLKTLDKKALKIHA